VFVYKEVGGSKGVLTSPVYIERKSAGVIWGIAKILKAKIHNDLEIYIHYRLVIIESYR